MRVNIFRFMEAENIILNYLLLFICGIRKI
jgi:hypothetical protein